MISLLSDQSPDRFTSATSLGWVAGGFGADEGRALHHLLSETFGKSALQPFRLLVTPGATQGSLYADARTDGTSLRQVADALARCRTHWPFAICPGLPRKRCRNMEQGRSFPPSICERDP